MKRINVFHETGAYGVNWMPESLPEAIKWLCLHLESVPVEHRSRAVVEIRACQVYDDACAELSIYYTRRLTESEREDAIAEQGRMRIVGELRERETLAKLQAKYSK